MKRLALLLFILVVFGAFVPQGTEPVLLWKMPFRADFFATDALGNFYTVQGAELEKFDASSFPPQKQLSYSSSYSGEIAGLDATDPLRVLVFYKNFNQLRFLDRQLAEIGSPIDLSRAGIDFPSAVCSSSQGGFWVFASRSGRLKYFDAHMQLGQQSVPLWSLAESTNEPDFLLEKNNQLYLHVPEHGIFVFDRFGAFRQKIPLAKNSPFRVSGEKILYFSGNTLLAYQPRLMKTDTICRLTRQPKAFDVGKNRLFVQHSDSLFVFRLKTE